MEHLQQAHQSASDAEKAVEMGQRERAMELYRLAASQYLLAIDSTEDQEAVKTLKLLYTSLTRQARQIQQQLSVGNSATTAAITSSNSNYNYTQSVVVAVPASSDDASFDSLSTPNNLIMTTASFNNNNNNNDNNDNNNNNDSDDDSDDSVEFGVCRFHRGSTLSATPRASILSSAPPQPPLPAPSSAPAKFNRSTHVLDPFEKFWDIVDSMAVNRTAPPEIGYSLGAADMLSSSSTSTTTTNVNATANSFAIVEQPQRRPSAAVVVASSPSSSSSLIIRPSPLGRRQSSASTSNRPAADMLLDESGGNEYRQRTLTDSGVTISATKSIEEYAEENYQLKQTIDVLTSRLKAVEDENRLLKSSLLVLRKHLPPKSSS